MAVAASNVIANADSTDQNSYTTASVSVTAGRLYLVLVRHTRDTAGTANTPTVTGASQTWEVVDTRLYATDSKVRTTLFRCEAASTTSGALTIDFAGQLQNQCGWIVDEITGQVQGANGANAIVQSTTGDSNGASVTSFSLTLAAFARAANAVWAGIRVATFSTTVTHEGGYSELAEQGTSGAAKAESEFKDSSDTSPSWTLGSDQVAGAIAVEINAAIPRSFVVSAG